MKALFYFVDGFGWNYLGVNPNGLAAADWSQIRPLETVLGYSSSIVPVLISGQPPAKNGIWTEYYRDDRRPSAVGSLAHHAKILATPLDMTRLVAFRIARKAGWQSAHKLRIPLELAHHFRRHPIDYKRMPPCALTVPTIADVCARNDLRMSFKFIANQHDADEAVTAIHQGFNDSDVFFLYDCTVDHAGHTYGPDEAARRPEPNRIVSTIDAVRKFARNRDALEILVFSDHGMTAVKQSFDIFAALHPLRIGSDFLAFPDSTFARFWYPTHDAQNMVREALRDAPGSFLTEAEADTYGVPYPDDRYGQDVLIADEGTVFHPSYISPTFFRTAFPDKGMHGYRPECATADGIVMYSGRAVEDVLPDRVPAARVFDIMCNVLAAFKK